MKNVKPALLAVSCALLAAVALPAQAVTVNDTYYGANDHGKGDRIGDGNYEITSMDVTRTGNILSVSVNTNFAGLGDNSLFAGSTNTTAGQNKGIGYGDLFLASTWNPDNSAANYLNDDNSTGTQWLYGFSLDNRWMAPGAGTGTLYSLNGMTNNDNVLISDDFMSGATYRNGQEVAVDTASTDTSAIAGNSSWNVDEANKQVNFSIDLTGTSLADSNSGFALHWAMTCANDTIEGEVNLPASVVPVPAAVWLFGSGLVGLVSIARRRQHS